MGNIFQDALNEVNKIAQGQNQPQANHGAEDFMQSIQKMNHMYDLPIGQVPQFYMTDSVGTPRDALRNFEKILGDEFKELSQIRINAAKENPTGVDELDTLVDIADLLGDIIVYCCSEATKYGIPIGDVLWIIMQSNFSKLGEDGLPIKDETGKFLKGPNYWEPELFIRLLLGSLMNGQDGVNAFEEVQNHIVNHVNEMKWDREKELEELVEIDEISEFAEKEMEERRDAEI